MNNPILSILWKYPPQTAEQRLLFEVIFLLPIIIAVAICGPLAKTDVIYTIVLTIFFGVNLILRFLTVNERHDWIFFVVGVVAGGGNDLLSMYNGVYRYTSLTLLPFLSGLMPLWNVCFWGQVFLLFRKIFQTNLIKGPDFKKDGKFLRGWIDQQLIVDIIFLVILRIIIYRTFMLDPWVPAIIYAGVIGLRITLLRPKRNELILIAILPYAFLFEGLMVTFELYEYQNPVFLGMPGWLFLWWLFLVPFVVKEIFDRMEYVLKEKN